MLNSGKHDTINPDDYTKVFGNYQDIDLYENIEGNNWQDQVFGRTGHTFNHNLSINGGSDKTKLEISNVKNSDSDLKQKLLSGKERCFVE